MTVITRVIDVINLDEARAGRYTRIYTLGTYTRCYVDFCSNERPIVSRATRIVFRRSKRGAANVPYRGKRMQIKVTIAAGGCAGVPSDNGATNGRNVVEQFPRGVHREKREVEKGRKRSSYCPLSRRVVSSESLNSFVTLFLDSSAQFK